MEFRDKMIFLMDLTKTSNKTLASAMNVDPSLISLIRTGRRNQPRNLEHIKAMSVFFAGRIQNILPSDVIKKNLYEVHVTMQEGQRLDDILFQWLCGAGDASSEVRVQKIMERLAHPFPANRPLATNMDYTNPINNTTAFYGEDGLYEAVRAFFRHLLDMKTPGTLYISNDTNSAWYLTNNELWQDTLVWTQELLRRGFHLVQILPSPSQSQFYDILTQWIPLYLTGQIDAYIYPRYRDQVFRSFIMAVPGQIVLFGNAMATQDKMEYTVVSKTHEFINAHLNMMREYLHLCQRTIVPHRTSKEVQDCLGRYRMSSGNLIQLTNTLPSSSVDIDCMRHIPAEAVRTTYTRDEYLRFFYLYQADMEKQRRNYTTIELCPVATAAMVAAGTIPQQIPGISIEQRVTYTCKAYRTHLRNIIRQLKNNPNYFFVPLPYVEALHPAIFLRPDRTAILMSTQTPIVLFEMNQPEMVRPFHQYLIDIAERMNYRNKQPIIDTLERLCLELELYIEKEELTV